MSTEIVRLTSSDISRAKTGLAISARRDIESANKAKREELYKKLDDKATSFLSKNGFGKKKAKSRKNKVNPNRHNKVLTRQVTTGIRVVRKYPRLESTPEDKLPLVDLILGQ